MEGNQGTVFRCFGEVSYSRTPGPEAPEETYLLAAHESILPWGRGRGRKWEPFSFTLWLRDPGPVRGPVRGAARRSLAGGLRRVVGEHGTGELCPLGSIRPAEPQPRGREVSLNTDKPSQAFDVSGSSHLSVDTSSCRDWHGLPVLPLCPLCPQSLCCLQSQCHPSPAGGQRRPFPGLSALPSPLASSLSDLPTSVTAIEGPLLCSEPSAAPLLFACPRDLKSGAASAPSSPRLCPAPLPLGCALPSSAREALPDTQQARSLTSRLPQPPLKCSCSSRPPSFRASVVYCPSCSSFVLPVHRSAPEGGAPPASGIQHVAGARPMLTGWTNAPAPLSLRELQVCRPGDGSEWPTEPLTPL